MADRYDRGSAADGFVYGGREQVNEIKSSICRWEPRNANDRVFILIRCDAREYASLMCVSALMRVHAVLQVLARIRGDALRRRVSVLRREYLVRRQHALLRGPRRGRRSAVVGALVLRRVHRVARRRSVLRRGLVLRRHPIRVQLRVRWRRSVSRRQSVLIQVRVLRGRRLVGRRQPVLIQLLALRRDAVLIHATVLIRVSGLMRVPVLQMQMETRGSVYQRPVQAVLRMAHVQRHRIDIQGHGVVVHHDTACCSAIDYPARRSHRLLLRLSLHLFVALLLQLTFFRPAILEPYLHLCKRNCSDHRV